ncbi:MAG: hypothetical protein AVDCRST_MAG66-3444 [uncultured Pseudonocardia sp.]|uniref:Uncharacterized protein n=1 Tax=uncultured Pseudonocardia sp. TaxID=211455 RepID=A0A6J4QCB8_9PSEU|nr:MAG: hypothetical protein AVDCRST_MAG66-3444 [uncultured Pseudonocardia sp.]
MPTSTHLALLGFGPAEDPPVSGAATAVGPAAIPPAPRRLGAAGPVDHVGARSRPCGSGHDPDSDRRGRRGRSASRAPVTPSTPTSWPPTRRTGRRPRERGGAALVHPGRSSTGTPS